jgi:hypothetical protein
MEPLKRLIDEELTPGSPEHALADLVRAAPVFERTSFDRERIFARVRIAASSPRRRVWSFAATALVLSVAGLSAAAAGRLWVSIPAAAPSPATSSAASPVAYSGPAPVSAPAVAGQDDLPSAEQPLADPPTTVVSPRPGRETPGARTRPDRVTESRHSSGEDPGPVLEAIRALRSRSDAPRASALLAGYLRAHPRSVLSEDALALSIEAALARHDTRSAAEFGRRYLEQFPNGRYRAFASQSVRPQP